MATFNTMPGRRLKTVWSTYESVTVENGDSDPLDAGCGYGTRLNAVGRAEGLSESCDIPTGTRLNTADEGMRN